MDSPRSTRTNLRKTDSAELSQRVERLPVDAVLDELCEAVRERRGAVLIAETGSGKTTRAAPALLSQVGEPGQVWLVQPRRVAARSVARRIAGERGGALGEEIGYQVRFDRRASATTRLLSVTPGILLERLIADPLLEGVAAIVFDEFHERSLDLDLSLALARRIQTEVREDLGLLVLSATLDPAPVAKFLGGVPVIRAEGRAYPVQVLHEPRRGREPLESAVLRALETHGNQPTGDVLVFLPGIREIRACAGALRAFSDSHGYGIHLLYGEQEAAEQDAVFQSTPEAKLILATNVAESSLTLPAVRLVIDSGLERRPRHDPVRDLSRLELGRCSRASAEQRAGRAGRVGPGHCVRLFSPLEERAMPVSIEAEVRGADPTRALLRLHAFGEREPLEFAWFEAPPTRRLERSAARLSAWGAVREGRLTELGERLAQLPLEPRLARLAVAGERHGVADRAALACALLSERDPWRGRVGSGDESSSDLLDRVCAFESGADLPRHVAAHLKRVASRIEKNLGAATGRKRGAGGGGKSSAGTYDPDEAFLRAVFEAYDDRLAIRREPGSPRARLAEGQGVELARESRVRGAELFVALELEGSAGADALCRQASAVERDWLDPAGFEERAEVTFDKARERVLGWRVRSWRGLELDRREDGGVDGERAAEVLARAALDDPERAFDLGRPEIAGLLGRVAWLREARPELGLPALVPDGLERIAESVAAGRRSFAELRRCDLTPWLRAELGQAGLAALEREAPERLAVPSGSKLRLVYEPGRPPVLAARIQELFGQRETPRVAGGRVAVLLHLLAPNGRPQQVTEDLESFWNTAYHVIRKELARRYPRHAWPEDPWNAVAEKRPARRRPPKS